MKVANILQQIKENEITTLEQVKKILEQEAKINSAKSQKCKANKAKK